jgi:hypothetical protein
MSKDLSDWPRPRYQGAGGRPFLFYVLYGSFPEFPPLDTGKYLSNGEFPGLLLSHYTQNEYPEVLRGFRQGYVWDELTRHDPEMAGSALGAAECLILKGELEDQSDLNFFRDTVGLVTFLLDQGGISVCDPQMLYWWRPEEWKERVFRPASAMPHRHVVILTSDEPEGDSLTWFHTRGMRKFGQPDLSVHRVPPPFREAVIDLCGRFIEWQALGGNIEEGQVIRMKTLPGGMVCHHAGDLDDPDFNNVHVEITAPFKV